jgi:uncharacterized protein YlzI (FlbEa/FlbD family)
MVRYLKLTHQDGTTYWVNGDQISHIQEMSRGGARLNFVHGDNLHVQESAVDVVKLAGEAA